MFLAQQNYKQNCEFNIMYQLSYQNIEQNLYQILQGGYFKNEKLTQVSMRYFRDAEL